MPLRVRASRCGNTTGRIRPVGARRVETERNFINKLWERRRGFALMKPSTATTRSGFKQLDTPAGPRRARDAGSAGSCRGLQQVTKEVDTALDAVSGSPTPRTRSANLRVGRACATGTYRARRNRNLHLGSDLSGRCRFRRRPRPPVRPPQGVPGDHARDHDGGYSTRSHRTSTEGDLAESCRSCRSFPEVLMITVVPAARAVFNERTRGSGR